MLYIQAEMESGGIYQKGRRFSYQTITLEKLCELNALQRFRTLCINPSEYSVDLL
jgi:hypothetical protein